MAILRLMRKSFKKTLIVVFVICQLFVVLFLADVRNSRLFKAFSARFFTRPIFIHVEQPFRTHFVPKKTMLDLDQNPVYAQFNIPGKKIKRKTNLLMIVSSAPVRNDRRSAIRDTWWQQCKSSKKLNVKCIFMTDFIDKSTKTGKQLLAEQAAHNDLEFQKLSGGVEFGRRFLYHMVWAMKNYDFDYFMRMDDDYFFCLERFLHELPMPMRRMYHWGFVHCISNIVRPEESIILLSRDLVETFLAQDPNEIKGHPWADQMVATWVQELKLDQLYNHDPRLHHDPPVRFLKNVSSAFKNVCEKFIGVHGSYPKDMRFLWTLRGGIGIVSKTVEDYSLQCNLPQKFDWKVFEPQWSYEPKRFIDNPVWNTSKQLGKNKEYKGRQEGQGLLPTENSSRFLLPTKNKEQ